MGKDIPISEAAIDDLETAVLQSHVIGGTSYAFNMLPFVSGSKGLYFYIGINLSNEYNVFSLIVKDSTLYSRIILFCGEYKNELNDKHLTFKQMMDLIAALRKAMEGYESK